MKRILDFIKKKFGKKKPVVIANITMVFLTETGKKVRIGITAIEVKELEEAIADYKKRFPKWKYLGNSITFTEW